MCFALLKDRICGWLGRLEQNETVPDGIEALNIGMFESDEGYYSLYMTGSEAYDEEDDDWACDQDYVPEEEYLPMQDCKVEETGWEEFQNQVIEAVSAYIDEHPESKMFDRIVTAGFDDGGLERIK